MSRKKPINRRRFLGKATASAAAIGFPYIVPAAVLGGEGGLPPSECVSIGAIGTGGRGSGDMRSFLSTGETRIAAICDIDATRRQSASNLLSDRYGITGCAAYNNFEEVIARDDVDAVLIATPDHWHGLIAIAAAKAGKDVY